MLKFAEYYNDIKRFDPYTTLGGLTVMDRSCVHRKGRNQVDSMCRNTLCDSSDTLSLQILCDWTRLKRPDIWKQTNKQQLVTEGEKRRGSAFRTDAGCTSICLLPPISTLCVRVITCGCSLWMNHIRCTSVFEGLSSFCSFPKWPKKTKQKRLNFAPKLSNKCCNNIWDI